MQILFINFLYVQPCVTCRLNIDAWCIEIVYNCFYFLSSALLSSLSGPPISCYWFFTAFCYFLLWNIQQMKWRGRMIFLQSDRWIQCEGRGRRSVMIWFFSEPTYFVPTSLAVSRFSPVMKVIVFLPLPPSKLYFHHLSFFHTSPLSISLSSALLCNLLVLD